VIEQLRAASVVAIPIADPDRLTGLSELNDALALGKPIVITCSPYTPIDVDEIGCGIVVDAQDEAGWREAIATLAHDDDLRTAMGARARAFAEREWNYERFCSDLVRLVIRTVAP
jgi:glycosyltransferase involved in cell wall biosynthesis